MKNSLNRFFAGIACAALIAGLSVPAYAAEAQPEPYTIQATQWSREDFSQDANPDVFTATYDRALYNTIRQTIVDGTSTTAPAPEGGSAPPAPDLIKKVGKTTYRVKVHFSETSKETMSDKIKRMLRNEISQM